MSVSNQNKKGALLVKQGAPPALFSFQKIIQNIL